MKLLFMQFNNSIFLVFSLVHNAYVISCWSSIYYYASIFIFCFIIFQNKKLLAHTIFVKFHFTVKLPLYRCGDSTPAHKAKVSVCKECIIMLATTITKENIKRKEKMSIRLQNKIPNLQTLPVLLKPVSWLGLKSRRNSLETCIGTS